MNIVEKYKSPKYASTLKVGEHVKLIKLPDGYPSGEGYGDIGEMYSIYKITSCSLGAGFCDDIEQCLMVNNKIYINLDNGLAWGCCNGTELEDACGRPIIYGKP